MLIYFKKLTNCNDGSKHRGLWKLSTLSIFFFTFDVYHEHTELYVSFLVSPSALGACSTDYNISAEHITYALGFHAFCNPPEFTLRLNFWSKKHTMIWLLSAFVTCLRFISTRLLWSWAWEFMLIQEWNQNLVKLLLVTLPWKCRAACQMTCAPNLKEQAQNIAPLPGFLLLFMCFIQSPWVSVCLSAYSVVVVFLLLLLCALILCHAFWVQYF